MPSSDSGLSELSESSNIDGDSESALDQLENDQTSLLSLSDELLRCIFTKVLGSFLPNEGFSYEIAHTNRIAVKLLGICRRLHPIVKAILLHKIWLEIFHDHAETNRNRGQQARFLRSPLMSPFSSRSCVRILRLIWGLDRSDRMKAVASETQMLISHFPALTLVELSLWNLNTAEIILYLKELDFPTDTNFKIAIEVNLRAPTRRTTTEVVIARAQAPVLDLDALETLPYYHRLSTFKLSDQDRVHEWDCRRCNVKLGGKSFVEIYLLGAKLIKGADSSRPNDFQTTEISLHPKEDNFSATGDASSVNNIAEPLGHRKTEVFGLFPFLHTLELDIRHFNLRKWKQLARLIPQTVRNLRLRGRELNEWICQSIEEPSEEESETPTMLHMSALRYIVHLPLVELRSDWIFYKAGLAAFDSTLFPPTLKTLEFNNVGQFPLIRFTTWLKESTQIPIEFLAMKFLDIGVFHFLAVHDFIQTCKEHSSPIRLKLESLDLRPDGSEYDRWAPFSSDAD